MQPRLWMLSLASMWAAHSEMSAVCSSEERKTGDEQQRLTARIALTNLSRSAGHSRHWNRCRLQGRLCLNRALQI